MHLNDFKILTPLKNGPLGTSALNFAVEAALSSKKLINRKSGFYTGRPVMITTNNYSLNLFNGDSGIIVSDEHKTHAAFLNPDNTVRTVSPGRLKSYETVFAMTIHKSQGSEFNHVAIVLPEINSSVLTRELLYTALSRAKKKLTLFATEKTIANAINSRVLRMSGLKEMLNQG
jgi:exodeoxyribonuclease V alpha subunit